MSVTGANPLAYQGVRAPNPPTVIEAQRAPNATDINYPIGTIWIDRVSGGIYQLTRVVAGAATWTGLGGGSADVNTINGLSPTAGNITIAGTAAQGLTVSNAGSTVTLSNSDASTTQKGVSELATAVETGTLTDATRTITPAGLAPILVTPFVVAPGGAYTTIQSAINAAIAAGGVSQCVIVRPGTYTEDLDFSGATVFTVGLTMVGATALGDEGQCEIIGTHIPPATGTLILRNFRLSDATAIFSSVAAGSSHLVIIDAELNVTNGYTFNLPNWTGIFELFDINPGTANDGGINNPTGGATFFMFSAGLGIGTGQTMQLSGPVVLGEADIACPVNFNTGSSIAIDVVQFSQPVTFSGNSTGQLNTCRFTGGASPAITMSSTAAIAIDVSVVQSSNNPAIAGAGAGTLSLGDITFTSNSALAGTLTVAYFASRLGAISTSGNFTFLTAGNKVITPAAANTATAGANSFGTVTLVAGTETVTTTAVTASSIILLTRQSANASAAVGMLTVGTVVAGTSFVIRADTLAAPGTPLAADVSTVGWQIIN